MSYPGPKKPSITIDSIRFYFDAVTRDTKNQSSLHRRLGKWFDLKDKLMLLSDENAEKILSSAESLLDAALKSQGKKAEEKKDTKENKAASLKLLKEETLNPRP